MKDKRRWLIGIVLTTIILTLVLSATKRKLLLPAYFPKPVYDFQKNPLSNEKIRLGRLLFYDPILSADSSISCASCHSPFNAFAHTDHALSHGINDRSGKRNAPALFNLAWQPLFMWDGAIRQLDQQALAPIAHPDEMGQDLSKLPSKIQAVSAYRNLFKQAFGDSIISLSKITKALSAFQLSLISANSRYDRVISGREKFTAQESKGYTVFKSHCNRCHTEPLFTSYAMKTNRLPADSTLYDPGAAAISRLTEDSFLFKVPSLRNLSYTYPYMHDGRFKNLRQVLAHYRSVSGPGVSVPVLPSVLTPEEETDLTAFLRTLTDSAFVFNPQNRFPQEGFEDKTVFFKNTFKPHR